MRRVVLVLVLLTGLGLSVPAAAAPPAAPPPAGWRTSGDTLAWTAPRALPMGGAEIQFWAGDRLLGAPRSTDRRTFTLRVPGARDLADLSVRAAGRRLDAAAPRTMRTGPAPVVPATRPAHPADPGVPGPYTTTSGEYHLPGLPFPGYETPIEMRGLVIAPVNAPGRRPLAVFLHGRHVTCYLDAETVSGDWPCPDGWKPIPSHRGYRQAQELLASQGYVTVSVSANAVNAQDYRDQDRGAAARSAVVRAHLARWAAWSGTSRAGAPPIVRSVPRADLSRVFLVGHSRGGEGVNRAAIDSQGKRDWTIRGLLLIGPTIFGHDPLPDMPSATILPGCDGDVFDLQGQMFLDATRGVSRGKALHSAIYMVGANHNFFNTEWTPGQAEAPAEDDFPQDFDDPLCTAGRPTRLSAAQQQQAGATYVATAARLFVAGDRRVLPLLDGSGVRAPSAGPARVLTHALGGERTPAVVPDRSLRVRGSGRLCEQVTEEPAARCVEPNDVGTTSPHFVPFGELAEEPGRYAVELAWTAAGQATTLRPARPRAVRGSTLAMRIVVPADTTGTRLGVVATDRRGRTVDLGEVRLDGLPGSQLVSARWGQEVRVPLKGLTSIAQLTLIGRSASGSAWLIDAWGRGGGLPPAGPVVVPRLDLGDVEVAEGDSGTRRLALPIRYTGRTAAQVRVFLVDQFQQVTTFVTTVRPGQRRVRTPITITGNTTFAYDETYGVGVKAVRGLVVADYVGTATITDDDPQPEFRVEPVAGTVTEGGTLRWRITLSAPADTEMYATGTAEPVTGGPELSTTDVDPQWLWLTAYDYPYPERPLSLLPVEPGVTFMPGQTTAELAVPTVTDDVAEPAERIVLRLRGSGREVREFGTVTGTVTPAE